MENTEKVIDNEKVGPITYKFTLKNIEKFLHDKAEDIKKGIEVKLDSFIATANSNIKKSDDKFTGMYNMLVRQFLTNLENRVYTNELSNKAAMLILGEKLYTLEVQSTVPGTEPISKEDFLKGLELEFVQKMTQVHNESEANIAKQQEEINANIQAPQETVATDVPQEAPAEAQSI